MFKQQPVQGCILIFGQYFLFRNRWATRDRDDVLMVQPHLRHKSLPHAYAATRVTRVVSGLIELSPPWRADAFKARQSKQELRNIWVIFQPCDGLKSEDINVH